jgi:uncharacterized delta-60 repeat protein
MSLARYNPNGTLDTTFGSGGVAVSKIAGAGVAAQYPEAGTANDGKIVEVGNGNTVARFDANGSIDTTFGTKGSMTLPWSGVDSVSVQPDGKIVVAGVTPPSNSNVATYHVSRLNVNGSIDTTFATKGTLQMSLVGISVTNYSHQTVTGYAAAQADGTILIDYPYPYLALGWGWYISRLTATGATDPTFSTTFTAFGSPWNAPNGAALPRGFAIYPATDTADAGEILAVGSTFQVPGGPAGGATVLARYSASGGFDTTFGTGGKVITAGGGTVSGVAIEPDGKVVVVGAKMQRYNTDGSLDTTFGTSGVIATAYSSVAVQPDGRIDAASATALARYLASEPQIGSFTAVANPVPSGGSETLTVSGITDGNPATSITQVAIYHIDGSGNQQVLGYGTQTSSGVWTLTFTVGLPSGNCTVFAQAEDSFGVFGDPDGLTLQVI